MLRWWAVGYCRTCSLDKLDEDKEMTYGEGERLDVDYVMGKWIGRKK